MVLKSSTCKLIIQEKHLDGYGHVNNAMYLILYEEARWDFIGKDGYTIETVKETGFGPVILEIKVTFQKELRLGDEILIETSTTSYEGKIGKLTQKMWRGEVLCSTAEMLIGLFDLKTRKLVLPTEAWKKAVGIASV